MQPEVIAERECAMGECPRWDADAGLLYWCDMLGGALFRYDPSTGDDERIYDGPNVGGFLQQPDGSLALFMEDGSVKRWDSGSVTTVHQGPGAGQVRFHDVLADPEGRVLCGTIPTDDEPSRLYRLDPDGTFTPLVTDVGIANGIGLSPDADLLYLADTERDRIDAFAYDAAAGTVGEREEFVDVAEEPGSPDGLAVDAQGYVWLAHTGGGLVVRYRPDGTVDARVPFPVPTVTSIEFGGPDRRTAYVTTGTDDEAPAPAAFAGALFQFDPGVAGTRRFRAATLQ